jgi:uncharacterized paraquat-inducible protein A
LKAAVPVGTIQVELNRIDIFMESLLGALVAFGSLIRIKPRVGALAFCAVVIPTMFAAKTFDARLMWNAAEQRSFFQEDPLPVGD